MGADWLVASATHGRVVREAPSYLCRVVALHHGSGLKNVVPHTVLARGQETQKLKEQVQEPYMVGGTLAVHMG